MYLNSTYGVQATWYRACAMTIYHCVYEHMEFAAQ